ncbi:hypothetical protein GCM10009838_40850 [Catenulispora subtropica]|uniref:Uncharacterized protein n=1 Tax=Catenulispora subtropica TaxID=450798 RepID=A0ABN2RWV3_9ACTN
MNPREASAVSTTSPIWSRSSSTADTVGFEIPVAREISAREIGALAPITPHTVRRFSSRTVAEVAPA